jgi:hypothetical protein
MNFKNKEAIIAFGQKHFITIMVLLILSFGLLNFGYVYVSVYMPGDYLDIMREYQITEREVLPTLVEIHTMVVGLSALFGWIYYRVLIVVINRALKETAYTKYKADPSYPKEWIFIIFVLGDILNVFVSFILYSCGIHVHEFVGLLINYSLTILLYFIIFGKNKVVFSAICGTLIAGELLVFFRR